MSPREFLSGQVWFLNFEQVHSTSLPHFHRLFAEYWARIGFSGKTIRQSLESGVALVTGPGMIQTEREQDSMFGFEV